MEIPKDAKDLVKIEVEVVRTLKPLTPAQRAAREAFMRGLMIRLLGDSCQNGTQRVNIEHVANPVTDTEA